MAILPILRYPNPRLKQVCKDVGKDIPRVAGLVQDMGETMFAASGAGLAAIQVGHPLRLFIVESEVAGRDPQDPPMVFIDPEILELSSETETVDEGCLSFPGIFVPVRRALHCRMRAKDIDGNTFEAEGEGLFARAMQHENDHLNGRLLSDFVGRLKRKMIERRLAREENDEAQQAVLR